MRTISLANRTMVLAAGLLVIVLLAGAVSSACQICVEFIGGSICYDPSIGGGGGGGGPGPTPTPTPPPPTAVGGFSNAGWRGSPSPDAGYHYGILDTSSNPGYDDAVMCDAPTSGAITYASNGVTDTSKSFPTGRFNGGAVYLGGYASGRIATGTVSSNNGQTITLTGNWTRLNNYQGPLPPLTDTPYVVEYTDPQTIEREQTGGGDLNGASFQDGGSALINDHLGLDAFWWLTSLEYAQNVCFFSGLTAQQWGAQQAVYFAKAIDKALGGYQSFIGNVFADVEPGPVQSNGDWSTSQSYWAENRQILIGFFTSICNAFGGFCQNGLYTSPSQGYGSVLGQPTTGQVGTTKIWMADFFPSLNTLNADEQNFTNNGFTVYSWQYEDNGPYTPSSGCHISYATARSDATNAQPYIPRFDVWTNDSPDLEC